jgi:predicted amino acid racemase
MVIGATSDHLVIGTSRSLPTVGSEMRFQLNYNALMHAMAAPDIEVTLLGDPPTPPAQHTQGKVEHLALL